MTEVFGFRICRSRGYASVSPNERPRGWHLGGFTV
jgi:hypothetical protein